MRRILVVVATASLLAVGWSGTAVACSCASGHPRDRLAAADAAFVGRLVEAPRSQDRDVEVEGGSPQTGVYVFAVDEVVKGSLGSRVEVEAPVRAGECGLPRRPGVRTGVLLRGSQGVWRTSLCSVMDPDALLRAAAPWPPPDGGGPVRFLVGGDFGEVGLMALDGEGRTLAYGFTRRGADLIAICPGSRTFLEIGASGPALQVWDLESFSVRRRVPLVRVDVSGAFDALECEAADGSAAVIHVSDHEEPVAADVILRVVDDEVQVVYRGSGRHSLFAAGVAFVAGGEWGSRVTMVDLREGEEIASVDVPLTAAPEFLEPGAVSPGGTRVAYSTFVPGDETAGRLVVIDFAADPPVVESSTVRTRGVVWIDDDTLAVGVGESSLLLDASTLGQRDVADVPVFAGSRVVDGTLYWAGMELVEAPFPTGPVRRLRSFDASAVALAVVGEPVPISVVSPADVEPPLPPAPVPPRREGDPANPSEPRTVAWSALVVAGVGAAVVLRRRRRRRRRRRGGGGARSEASSMASGRRFDS